MEIKIKYHTDIEQIEKFTQGDWIDLRSANRVILEKGEFYLLALGVSIQLPKGYEAHLAPRSSTFKKWGILQVNSVGVIDESYCGDDDQWFMAVYATKFSVIEKNDRICQFRIIEKQPEIEFKIVDLLENKNRGGHGSTGSQ